MEPIEEFLCNLTRRQSQPSAAFASDHFKPHPDLPDLVRQAANRGWQIFPVPPLAKLKGNPDLLIAEATSDISRLQELAAEYPQCDWRVAVGPSSLCIVALDGAQARSSFAALSQDHEDCLTLQAQRGDIASWAFFRWPVGVLLRKGANTLASGVRVLGPGDSCIIPPSGGTFYVNPWAEVDAVPWWLRELAFDTPDITPAKTVPVPASSSRPLPCRSRTPFEKPHRGTRTGYSVSGQAGWRSGYRISRRR